MLLLSVLGMYLVFISNDENEWCSVFVLSCYFFISELFKKRSFLSWVGILGKLRYQPKSRHLVFSCFYTKLFMFLSVAKNAVSFLSFCLCSAKRIWDSKG